MLSSFRIREQKIAILLPFSGKEMTLNLSSMDAAYI